MHESSRPRKRDRRSRLKLAASLKSTLTITPKLFGATILAVRLRAPGSL